MYERKTNSENTVEWTPPNDTLAVRAMELTDGTGVPSHVVLPDEANVPVGDDVARRVREAYRWLDHVAEHDGEDAALDYDDRTALQDRYEELQAKHEDDTSGE